MSVNMNTVRPSVLILRLFAGLLPLVVAGGLLAGCASSKAPRTEGMGGDALANTNLRSEGSTTGLNVTTRTEVSSAIIMAPPDAVFKAVSAAYSTLKIPVTEVNQANRTIGNAAYRIRRRIGDVPTMKAVDCGGDSGMPNAETYQLLLTIRTRVTANDAGGSVVQSTVEGSGRNPTTAGSSDVICTSTGGLEKRIAELVKENLKP